MAFHPDILAKGETELVSIPHAGIRAGLNLPSVGKALGPVHLRGDFVDVQARGLVQVTPRDPYPGMGGSLGELVDCTSGQIVNPQLRSLTTFYGCHFDRPLLAQIGASLSNLSSVAFVDCRFNGSNVHSEPGWGGQFAVGGTRITFDRCRFTDAELFLSAGTTESVVRGCTFDGDGSHVMTPLRFFHASHCAFISNVFRSYRGVTIQGRYDLGQEVTNCLWAANEYHVRGLQGGSETHLLETNGSIRDCLFLSEDLGTSSTGPVVWGSHMTDCYWYWLRTRHPETGIRFDRGPAFRADLSPWTAVVNGTAVTLPSQELYLSSVDDGQPQILPVVAELFSAATGDTVTASLVGTDVQLSTNGSQLEVVWNEPKLRDALGFAGDLSGQLAYTGAPTGIHEDQRVRDVYFLRPQFYGADRVFHLGRHGNPPTTDASLRLFEPKYSGVGSGPITQDFRGDGGSPAVKELNYRRAWDWVDQQRMSLEHT